MLAPIMIAIGTGGLGKYAQLMVGAESSFAWFAIIYQRS